MNESYEGIITIPVSIPAEIIEGGATSQDVHELFEYVCGYAEDELVDLVAAFRAANR